MAQTRQSWRSPTRSVFSVARLPFPVPARASRFVASALFASLLTAAPAPAADLLQVYRLAQGSDAVYAAARAGWSATQEKLPQGRAGLLPSVTFSASTQKNDRETHFRNPGFFTPATSTDHFNSNSWNVTLTQPLYRRQNLIAYEQAKTQVSQADAQLALAGQDMMLRVSQAYFDVLLALNNVDLAAAQKVAIGEQLAQAKRNFEVGTATITDTHEAQARYDLAVAQEIAAQNDLEIKRRQLAQIIGRPAPALTLLTREIALELPQPNRIEPWVEEATRANLQVLVGEAALAFARQEVDRNRGGHYPTLDAVATYSDAGAGAGTQAGSSGFDATTRAIGLQLAVPLYQGGATASRVREALANEDRARQELENARRAAELAAHQAFLGVTNGTAQVRALRAALVSSQSSLDSTRLGLEVGVRTQVDVLNATQQIFTTRRDLAQAAYTYVLSLLRLKAAVGRLDEDDLAKVNAWLK
jgi:outer membrane protein